MASKKLPTAPDVSPDFSPDFSNELRWRGEGFLTIAGADEAGRGPLAGPVVAAAAVLDENNIPKGLNDSKKLTEKKREALFDEIMQSAKISISVVSAKTIDEINILQASLLAMNQCLHNLETPPDFALIDGRDLPHSIFSPMPCAGEALIKGDGRSLSIAAASIIAKVTRDRLMVRADEIWPQYGFAGHKGYGTKAHVAALHEFGACPLHRKSFQPLKGMLAQ